MQSASNEYKKYFGIVDCLREIHMRRNYLAQVRSSFVSLSSPGDAVVTLSR